MIHFILSEVVDISTNRVIDWLIYHKQSYIRYNEDTLYKEEFDFGKIDYLAKISNSQFSSEINFSQKEIGNKIQSIWFRRPYNGVKDMFVPNKHKEGHDIQNKTINDSLKLHYFTFKEMAIEILKSSSSVVLGSYNIRMNKPIILQMASKFGLEIPETIITNSYSETINFLKQNKTIISKALYEGVSYKESGSLFSQLTKRITKISQIPKVFSFSLFQKYIDKQYELRIVYLNNEFYSMAIFSQNNKKTEVDFRNYDNKIPNRMVPYELDNSIKKGLRLLLKELSLNMASIDMIKSTDGKMYFLEINPVGQYDFVSNICNYNLHFEIAKQLINGKQ